MGVQGAKIPHFLKAPLKIARKINDLRLIGAQLGAFLYIYILLFIFKNQTTLKKNI